MFLEGMDSSQLMSHPAPPFVMIPSYLLGLLVLRNHEKKSTLGLESSVDHFRLPTEKKATVSMFGFCLKQVSNVSLIHPSHLSSKYNHEACEHMFTGELVNA